MVFFIWMWVSTGDGGKMWSSGIAAAGDVFFFLVWE